MWTFTSASNVNSSSSAKNVYPPKTTVSLNSNKCFLRIVNPWVAYRECFMFFQPNSTERKAQKTTTPCFCIRGFSHSWIYWTWITSTTTNEPTEIKDESLSAYSSLAAHITCLYLNNNHRYIAYVERGGLMEVWLSFTKNEENISQALKGAKQR